MNAAHFAALKDVAMFKEDQHTEFKRLWKDEYLREISAFANSDGGTLYVGVDDDGTKRSSSF